MKTENERGGRPSLIYIEEIFYVMALPESIAGCLSLPAICAPMFAVSGPELVREACRAGLVGAFPSKNAGDLAGLDGWLEAIRKDLRESEDGPDPVGPIAVSLASSLDEEALGAHLDVCARRGVRIIITAARDPTVVAKRAHDLGMLIFHDVTNMRFVEKAIAAGVDGLNCIASGGGGHSGLINPFVFVRRVRAMFSGTIVLGGAVSDGFMVRAARVLGADLAYMGTRFIATRESRATPEYKQALVENGLSDLMYTDKLVGVHANWLRSSMLRAGLDPQALPEHQGRGRRHDHLPPQAVPWRTVWSAGQGMELIQDIPSVRELVDRLLCEYGQASRQG